MSLPQGTPYDPSQIPALQPPPGVIPNFNDPYTRGPVLIALSAVAIAIMYLFVIIRLYCKVWVHRKVSWDDRKSTLKALATGIADFCEVTCTIAAVGFSVQTSLRGVSS